MIFQGNLAIFPARDWGGERLGPALEVMFKPSELFFPDKGGVSIDCFAPGASDNMVEALLMDPKGTEPERDGAKIFLNRELKEDWFMIGDTVGKDFGRSKKPQGEEGGADEKPVKAGRNMPRP